MSRWNTILFDLDGTLIDTIADLADATEAALRDCGRGREDGRPVHSVDDYYRFVGNGCLKLVERAIGEASPEEITRVYERFMELYDQNYCVKTAPYDGIYDLLDELTKRGYKLGIVTNKPEPQARKLAELLFGKYPFGCVYGGAVEGRPHKPDPQVVRLALQDLNAVAEETLFVGDSDVDVYTGHNAGMVTAGAVWGFRGEDELRAAGADILIDHPLELLQYL